ncbi:MAG: hypothetical protein JW751_01415 [Polyangiaceae bacterium]|nr:hypothetical protein [Polyangiaceae bacterium]
MKAWLKVVGLGCVVGSIAVACTITEGDPDDGIGGANTGNVGNDSTGGRGNEGGDPSTGGRETGGTSTGGTSEGGANTGGTDVGGEGGASPNICVECLQTTCADAFAACQETEDTIGIDLDGDVFTGPNGTADCIDEFVAYQECIEAAWKDDCNDYLQADCDGAAALTGDDPLEETNVLVNCVRDTPMEGEDPAGVDCIAQCLDFTDSGAGGASACSDDI